LNINLPSLRMPTFRHFFKRQCWHWFRWCWSIGQLRWALHVYVKLLLTLRLKKLLQPATIDDNRDAYRNHSNLNLSLLRNSKLIPFYLKLRIIFNI